MSKIDLIIDALEKLDNQAHVNDMDLIAEALTAARELKALKPLAYYDKRYDSVITAYELGRHVDSNDVPLYPLEASNENAPLP
jgi:hypothetical protein